MGEDTICYNSGEQPETHTGSIILGSVRRTVWSHDGIIDIFLEPINQVSTAKRSSAIILEMSMPSLVKSATKMSWKRMGHREFWLQKDGYRITVFTSHTVAIASPTDGMIQMFILVPENTDNKHAGDGKPGATFQMRIVVEQADPTRPDGHERTSFGKLVAEDFFQPVEKFLVVNEQVPSDNQGA